MTEYSVVKLSRGSYNGATGAREVAARRGMHTDLHAAVVECTAVAVYEGHEGTTAEWAVIDDADATRNPIQGEDCEAHEVYEYLVDQLGVPAEEAERLVG